MPAARTWLPCLLLATVAGASAQTVFRCGNTYQQLPCPQGREVEVDDKRTAEQGAQTRAAARRDALAGDALERDRLKQEALAGHATKAARPQPLSATPAEPEHSPARKPLFTAREPHHPGNKKSQKAQPKASTPASGLQSLGSPAVPGVATPA